MSISAQFAVRMSIISIVYTPCCIRSIHDMTCTNHNITYFSIAIRPVTNVVSPFTGPVRVSVRVISDDTAVVSWTTSHTMVCDIAIGNYSVMYQLWNGTGDYTIVYTSSTSITLQGLMPNTTYTVSVAAINSVGNISEFSNTTQFTTSSSKLKAI